MQRVRDLATALGERLGIAPVLRGTESPDAWLVNCAEAERLFGPPRVPIERLLDWTAAWVGGGGATLGKDTHFDARDGRY